MFTLFKIKIFNKNLFLTEIFVQEFNVISNFKVFINQILIILKNRAFSVNDFWDIVILFKLNWWKLNPRSISSPVAHQSISLLTGLISKTSDSLKIFTGSSSIDSALFLLHPFLIRSARANRYIFWKVRNQKNLFLLKKKI